MQEKYNSHIIYSIILSGIIYFAIFMYKKSTWMQCQSQRRKLRRQGVKGPPPCSFLYGNLPQMQLIQSATAAAAARDACRGGGSDHDDGGVGVGGGGGGGSFVAHDYTSSLFPHFQQWRKEFGPIYTYSTGNRQHMYVNEPEVVREMSQSMSLDLGKPSYVTKALAPMLGNGILRSNGLGWAKQRKIVAPEFFMNKVKGMVGLMREAAEPVLKKWEDQSGGGGEVRVDDDFRAISADVISRACFGSSYSTGKHIFLKLRTLQTLLSQHNFLFKVPSFRFLNTKLQKEIKSLEKEIESLIWDAVQDRVRECSQAQSSPSDHDPRDLMQLILDGALQDQDLSSDSSSKHFIVDNCKNFYFAGHESTAVAASWCTMLLALHPEWQDKIRAELSQLTKGDLFDVESLVKMKSVTMVIQEALRLYPPAAFISREALEDFRMGSILIPKGVCLWTLIPTLHRDPDIWGPNANEFKPERFANGVAHACKVPQAYVPFGLGARLCLGKNFAMVQLKVLICLIVCKFRFTLSPRYKHSPSYKMIVEPGHGVRIIVRRI